MRKAMCCSGLVVLVAVLVAVVGSDATAWETYSVDGDATNCRACHGDFRAPSYTSLSDGQDWGNLHNLHRFDMLDGDCDTCHQAASNLPVFLDDSAGGEGFESIGCVGCHGRNEDNVPAAGFAAGLRQHHFNAAITVCLDCHDDADPAAYTPVGEDVPPSYYFTPDAIHPNKPTDPCNPNGEEDYAGIAEGLDNDGDSLYDGADPDCAGQPDCWDEDVNCDGVVSAADLIVVRDSLNWTLACSAAAVPRADVNRSGSVTAADLIRIRDSLVWTLGSGLPCTCADPVPCP